jgi:hypothetical protein
MKLRLSKARGVFRRIHFDSNGALVPLLDYQIRKSELVDEAVGGYTHSPEMDFHLREKIKGQYFRLCEAGLFDIFHDRVSWADYNPIFIPDNEEFVTGDPIDPPDGWFGDGGDGTYTLDGVQGAVDGLFTVVDESTYKLARDAFFDDLTIDANIMLKTGGFRLFVRGTLTVNGFVDNSGYNGNHGSNATSVNGGGAQPGGLAGDEGSLHSMGDGGDGKEGANAGPGNPGDPGDPIYQALMTAGGSIGGAGGAALTGEAGGAGGGVSTVTLAPANFGGGRDFLAQVQNRIFEPSATHYFTMLRASGGGGGGGGNAPVGRGGGGGPAGGNGGYVVVCAKAITGSGIIQSNGGDGGDGGDGWAQGGGGGGGAGGTGGILVIVYNSMSGVTRQANGGTAGAGGAEGGGGGQNGSAGNNGTSGLIYELTAV